MYVTQKLTYKRYNKTKITTIREENEHLACLDISLHYCQRWQTFRVFFQLNQMKAKIMDSAPQLWKNIKRNNLFYLIIKGIYREEKLDIYRNHISKRWFYFEGFIMTIKHSQMCIDWFIALFHCWHHLDFAKDRERSLVAKVRINASRTETFHFWST